MKILMKPIEVLAHFENGKVHPLRLKFADQDAVKIEQVVSTTEDKLAGNKILTFLCQSEIKGELRPFRIKFEINTCKWYLWKM